MQSSLDYSGSIKDTKLPLGADVTGMSSLTQFPQTWFPLTRFPLTYIVDSTYVVSINVVSTNVVFTKVVFANAVSTNAIFFSLQFHEYPWPITTSVQVMNTMIVLIIRTVTTLRDHTLALARMDIMTCLDLIPCQAEFVQVI